MVKLKILEKKIRGKPGIRVTPATLTSLKIEIKTTYKPAPKVLCLDTMGYEKASRVLIRNLKMSTSVSLKVF